MNKYDIIEAIAREQMVEKVILSVTHRQYLTPSLSDLSQMIYETLLNYKEDLIAEAYANRQIKFLVIRMVMNQYTWKNGLYHATFRKYYERMTEIDSNTLNIPDE